MKKEEAESFFAKLAIKYSTKRGFENLPSSKLFRFRGSDGDVKFKLSLVRNTHVIMIDAPKWRVYDVPEAPISYEDKRLTQKIKGKAIAHYDF